MYQVVLLYDKNWGDKRPGKFGAAELKMGRMTEN